MLSSSTIAEPEILVLITGEVRVGVVNVLFVRV